MANEALTSDPLAWLKQSLETDLESVGATVEYKYSSPERGSLTVHHQGKVLQTSYFSSWELQALKDGGPSALEKQKRAFLQQIDRLLNPPKPQSLPPLTSVTPAKRGRGAKKPAAEEAAPAASSEGNGASEEGGDEEME
jgi:hypothetical protein